MLDLIIAQLEWFLSFYLIWSPSVHAMAIYLYDVLFFPMLFFSLMFYFIAFSGVFAKKPAPTPLARIRNWPKVSIHIPTLNEIVAIRCAKECLKMDYPKDRMEILIGDDSTQKAVSRKLDDFARRHPMILVTRRRKKTGFKAGNLNHMLKESSGEIIVNFDSDFIPPKDFLRKVVPEFVRDESMGFVQAKWDYMNMTQNLVSRFATAVLMMYHNVLAHLNNYAGVPLLFGSGQAVRKEVLEDLGGWHEGHVTEDVDLSVRALEAGWKSKYCSDVKVSGEVPFTAEGFFKQQKRWAYGNTKTFMDHKRWIMLGKNLYITQRIMITLTTMGYLASIVLILFMFFGALSFMTATPEALNISLFFRTTAWIMVINSGFLVAMSVALVKENRISMLLHVLIGAFTIGLYSAIGVTQGFLKALAGRDIEWYMIRKPGNEGSGQVASPGVS